MTIKDIPFNCSKHFREYPCSHRQWKHKGHCRYVHGYSRSFTFWFASNELDENGFVVDFSSLRPLEKKLREHFDHTFLVNFDDPLLETWKNLHSKEVLDLRVMNNVGMESTAQLVWGWANDLLFSRDKGRSCCLKTIAHENDINSASYDSGRSGTASSCAETSSTKRLICNLRSSRSIFTPNCFKAEVYSVADSITTS